jgi:hypothetical protein
MELNAEFFQKNKVAIIAFSFIALLLVGNLVLTLTVLRSRSQVTPSPTPKVGFLASPSPTPIQPVVPSPVTLPTPLPPVVQTPVPFPTPEEIPPTVPGFFINPLTGKPLVVTLSLGKLLQTVVSLLIMGSVFLAFIFLIFGGVKFILSGGDEKKSQEAKKVIINSLVGLGIIVLSYLVLTFMGNVLGIDLVALINLLGS